MPAQPSVYVIVLNWNGWSDTVRCIESLRASTFRRLHVIVIDNGSTTGSPDQLAHLLFKPWGELIRLRHNLGFTGGANAGIRMSLQRGADYVFLLNNDATVSPECIDMLVEAAEGHAEIGLTGPKILCAEEPERIWSAGVGVVWRHAEINGHYGEMDGAAFTTRREVPALSGCALLIKRSVIERIGMFDERYFAYYEDMDFCWRAARAGFRCLYVGDACVMHTGSATSNRDGEGSQSPLINYYATRNGLLFVSTYAPRGVRLLAKASFIRQLFGAEARVIAGGLILHKPNMTPRARAIAEGLGDAIRGNFGAHQGGWD